MALLTRCMAVDVDLTHAVNHPDYPASLSPGLSCGAHQTSLARPKGLQETQAVLVHSKAPGRGVFVQNSRSAQACTAVETTRQQSGWHYATMGTCSSTARAGWRLHWHCFMSWWTLLTTGSTCMA